MFSQGSIDSMSVDELAKTIRSFAIEVCNRYDSNAHDALDYANALRSLTDSLTERLEDYLED
jgi:hypothetical protein